MKEIKRYEMEWAGRPLVIEFNRFANQANAACTVQYGGTMVLVTAVMSEEARDDVSYFPLQVEYKENLYSAGKISGSRFIKREGRPSDDAVLSGRIIDRSIRPLFTEDIRNDIQVMITVLSYEEGCDPDVAGLIGSAAALMVSNIPWNAPLAGCVVAVKDGEYHINPNTETLKASDINVFVSGRNMETIMLEADGRNADETVTYNAIEFALKELEPVNALLTKIQQEIGEEKIVFSAPTLSPEEEAMKTAGEAKAAEHYAKVGSTLFGSGNKRERRCRHDEAVKDLKVQLAEEDPKLVKFAVKHFDHLFAEEMIRRIFEDGKRVDDRGLDEIRHIEVDVDLIPRVHGSGMFSRGDTQILSVVTLGSPSFEQILDTMRLDEKRRYFHHYNFPPFSVGEAKPMRGPGRREIGHGALAEKALLAVLPKQADFPYTIRVVSEVLSSNGSSSQGSICGSSLALMAAGVPISEPVAGIAMGIALRGQGTKDQYVILTDMQDVEDYDQSMDFKVAGTRSSITAIQLDIKLDGLTLQMVKDTLEKAKVARVSLLDKMTAVIPEPRKELSEFAPRIETLKIDPTRIGELIGPGGKVINGIIDKTGAQIDIEEDGLVFVTATSGDSMQQTIKMINEIFKQVEVGEVYTGEVVKIIEDRNNPGKEIGAIVQLTANIDGMIHISQVANERINKVSDVLKEGDDVTVKVLEVDRASGRVSLSRKAMLDSSSSN